VIASMLQASNSGRLASIMVWQLRSSTGAASPLVAAFFAYSGSRSATLREELSDADLALEIEKFRKVRNEPRTVFALNARRVNEIFFTALRKELGVAMSGRITGLSSPTDIDEPEEGLSLAERIAEQLFQADVSIYAACREAVLRAELKVPRVISPLSGENRRLVNQRGLFTKLSQPRSLEDWVVDYFKNEAANGRPSNEPILLKIDLPNAEKDRSEALRSLDAANLNYLSLFPDLSGAVQFSNGKIRTAL
jgi:hypothetical protein